MYHLFTANRGKIMRLSSLTRLVFLGVVAFWSITLPSSQALAATTVTVTVNVGQGGNKFDPSMVNINVGDTVMWVWKANGHSVTEGVFPNPSPDFDSGVQDMPFTFSHTFTDPGTVDYHCKPHAFMGMVGTVVVAGGTPTPTPTPTPTATPTPTPSPSPSVTPTPSPSPSASPSPSPSATPSPTPSPTPTPAAQSLNVSTRLEVGTGDKVSIGGIIISDGGPKRVLLRAIGPSLGTFGITDPLADPVLDLHGSDGSSITMNDNWKDSSQAGDITATGLAPNNDLESAIIATLDPGSYTAIVTGKDGGTGVGLVEAYDLDQAAASQLANISTRGFVETGNNVMIGGFILGPDGALDGTVLVRAIGPALTDFGVTDALADPVLELHDANGTLITSNDNWMDNSNAGDIEATGLAPSNNLESAILMTLPPAGYTAIVSGNGGGTGVALVEIYRIP